MTITITETCPAPGESSYSGQIGGLTVHGGEKSEFSSGDSSFTLSGTIGSETVTAGFPYPFLRDPQEFPDSPNVQGQQVVTTATLTVTQG